MVYGLWFMVYEWTLIKQKIKGSRFDKISFCSMIIPALICILRAVTDAVIYRLFLADSFVAEIVV